MVKIKLFCLFVFVVLISCEVTPKKGFTPETTSEGGPEDIPIINNLFFPSDIPGQTLFETNDPRHWSGQGASLWFVLTEELPEFKSREVELSKLSGDNTAGYGLIAGYQNDPVYGQTMLVVLINTLKEYTVAEITDNTPEMVVPWTESSFLNGGYNRRNSLKLEYEKGEYSLFINNRLETTFRDDDAPWHNTGLVGSCASYSTIQPGRQGYMVIISPRDDFPDTAVKIQFTEIRE